MKTIIFYVSNHGFGHLTRTIAIAEKILKTSNYNISYVSGEKQINFAKKYLANYKEKIEFRIVNNDIGLINNWKSLEVDKKETLRIIDEYLKGFDFLLSNEYEYYKNIEIDRIIVDISILGIHLGKKLGVYTSLIGNFTWCQQYEYLDFPKELINQFKNTYKLVDEIIEYDLSLGLKEYNENVIKGHILAREIDSRRVEEIRAKYGRIIMISCGQSATLSNIHVSNFPGTIIKTRGIEVTSTSPIIELDFDVLDTQNYVSASEIIITKAGWGTIGEGLVGHTPLVLMERDVREDKEMIDMLKERKLAVSIKPKDMKNIDYLELGEKIDKNINIDELHKIENNLDNITNYFLKNCCD